MKCSKCKSGKVQSWKIQLEILTNHGTIWTTFLGNSGKCSQWEVGSGSPLPDWFIHAGGVPRRYVTYNPSGIHWGMGSVRWPAMHILVFNENFGPLSNFNSYTANTGIGLRFSGRLPCRGALIMSSEMTAAILDVRILLLSVPKAEIGLINIDL